MWILNVIRQQDYWMLVVVDEANRVVIIGLMRKKPAVVNELWTGQIITHGFQWVHRIFPVMTVTPCCLVHAFGRLSNG